MAGSVPAAAARKVESAHVELLIEKNLLFFFSCQHQEALFLQIANFLSSFVMKFASEKDLKLMSTEG